jgi:uncharacterized protein (DUF2267 family)
MDYEQFLSIVQERAGIGRQEAETLTRATLETLSERLSRGETEDLAKQLPPELARWLARSQAATPEPFDRTEFMARLASRAEVTPEDAERLAKAVFYALGRTVTTEEIADMAAELPKDLQPLVLEAMRRDDVRIIPVEDFVRLVAERNGLDPEGARRATEAVLETLAERVTRGEVEDLMEELPTELHDPLRRGDALSNGAARKMNLDEFLRLVAEREGVTPDQAREHTRAVFGTLRQALSEKEFDDIVGQLPKEFAAVIPRP